MPLNAKVQNVSDAHRKEGFGLAISYPNLKKVRRRYYFVTIDLIWNVAPGSSEVSAWTVALMPMLARAPRIMPQGNQRN
jgi:hypothetical protein